MAKAVKRAEQRRKALKAETLPLSKENFIIIGVGLVVILAGYFVLARGPVEGFMPLVLAPLLLLIGYCVIIPLGILYKKSYIRAENSTQARSAG